MPNTLPFGTQFSPNQIELPQLLQLVIENEGDDTAPLITAIVDTFLVPILRDNSEIWQETARILWFRMEFLRVVAVYISLHLVINYMKSLMKPNNAKLW